MAGEAAQDRFEYRFMEFLNWLDVFLKEHIHYVFLAMVFAALALLIWWMIRRRPAYGRGSGKVDLPLTGIFDFTRSPKPGHLRDEPLPTPGQYDSSGRSDHDAPSE